MSAVANFVSNVASAVGNGVSKVVNFVGKTVSNTISDALKNPIRTLATIAAYALAPATGGLSVTIGLPVINAASVLANGGNIGQALLSAGASVAGNFVAGSTFVNSALTSTFGEGVAKNLMQGAIRGGVTGGLQGRDIGESALGGAISQGVGSAIGDFGVRDYLGASLGAGAGYLASNTLTDTLRGGLTNALRGRSFEEGAAQGAGRGLTGGFMDQLGNLGSSARSYFGNMYKSSVEPLYNAQVKLQEDLQNQGTELQALQDEYRTTYDSYSNAQRDTQALADQYNTQVNEFNDLRTRYDQAVADGDTETANSLATQANAKADEANRTYESYTQSNDALTAQTDRVTQIQDQYQQKSGALREGVLTYQANLTRLQEAAAPLVQVQQQQQQQQEENWYENLDGSATPAGSGEPTTTNTFDDGSSIQMFDDGSQIITQVDGTQVVYNSDGTRFNPGEGGLAEPISSQALSLGRTLMNQALANRPQQQQRQPGRLRPTRQAFGGQRAQQGIGVGIGGIGGGGMSNMSDVANTTPAARANVNANTATDTSSGQTASTDYGLGYETDYGRNLGGPKITAIAGINAPNVKPNEQFLTFGQDQAVSQNVSSNNNETRNDEAYDYLSDPMTAKRGGHVSRGTFKQEAELFSRGRMIKGAGDGTSDDIAGLVIDLNEEKQETPILVARDEYILPATVVSKIGNGSSDAGAERLDKWVEAINSHKSSGKDKRIEPDTKNLNTYFRGGLA